MAQPTDNAARPGLPARLWRAYRDDWRRGGRGFRLRWWDALVLVALIAAEAAFVVGMCWQGRAFLVMLVGVTALACATPVAVLHLAIFWRSRWAYARVANPIAVLALAGLVAFAALLPAGRRVHYASVEETKRAGSAVAEEIERYRQRRGVYPNTLWDLERDAGRALPRPTAARTFDYYPMCDDVFKLRFGGGSFDVWVFNTLSREWEIEASH